MAFELPPLPYDYSALEPTIDTATMKLHHDMHHAAYVKNLNAALEKHPTHDHPPGGDVVGLPAHVLGEEDRRVPVKQAGDQPEVERA